MKRYLLVPLFVFALGGEALRAAPYTLDFVITPALGSNGGLWSFSGGSGNPFNGTGIEVDQLTVIRAPFNSGVTWDLIDGSLDFSTGGFVDGSSTSMGSMSMATLNYGVGGTIMLTGVIDIDDDNTLTPGDIVGDESDPLMIGQLTDANVMFMGSFGSAAVAAFWDTKNDEMEDLVGIPGDTEWQGMFNISFQAGKLPSEVDGYAFEATSTLSGDIINTVPEPVTALLLGTGSLGLGLVQRRRRRRRKVA